jgi:hypothetical protein
VLHFQGCLDSVPSGERRVLELRAGVGATGTRSRTEVAHLTGLQRKSVARLERRGLKRLHALAEAGTCAGAASGSPSGLPIAGSAPSANAGGARGAGVLRARARPQSAESKSSDDHHSAIQAAVELRVIHGLGHSLDLGLLLLALGLGGALYLVGRELKRST